MNQVDFVRTDRRWAFWVAVFAMALTLLPYLAGKFLEGAHPSLARFLWLGYNLDDSSVYLSWMRQAADGHFYQRNLFTTESQLGHQFNAFFLLLGNIARFGHLPLILVYHLARLALGLAFLRSVWWLSELVLSDHRARRWAYLLVCFSAGLGWIPGIWRQDGASSPVDVWQPEAITFLSLYQSPLFLVSMLLMVGVLGWMLVAERERRMRYAVFAGLCGLILGNVHTYDVITLISVWTAYLLVRAAQQRRFDAQSWLRGIVAGGLACVSSAQMLYLVRADDAFGKRVAVETLSPPFMHYVLGYGLLVPLAIFGARRLILDARSRSAAEPVQDTASGPLFLIVWAVVNVAVAYLPVAFQRKMLMGAHLPIAMLAGVALVQLAPALRPLGRFATVGVVGLLSLTNWRFLARDIHNFQSNSGQSGIQRPYLYQGEIAALEWIREHTPEGTRVQPLPWIRIDAANKVSFIDTTVACLTPGLTGRPVNAGHWGETPNFGETMGRWRTFVLPNTTDEARRQLLEQTGVRYLVFSQKRPETNGGDGANQLVGAFLGDLPPYLKRVPEACNSEADVIEVNLAAPSD